MAKKEDYKVDLKSFLSPVDVANHLGEGIYHTKRSQPINVLLIGRSQTGKSTIADNLLDPYFISRPDGYSTTTDPACISITLSTPNDATYYNVNIIDTPGLRERRLNVEEGRQDDELLKLATRCIEDHITFVNVVCFVSIIGKTHELDVEVFEYVQSFLGPRYSSNAMLLFTHCDQLVDEMTENTVREMKLHAPTKRIMDYCQLGVKYFGTVDYAELAKWQHKPDIQKELVINALKRVEVWRSDLLKTFIECTPIATKELEAIRNFNLVQKEQLQKTWKEEVIKEMEQLQKTVREQLSKERLQLEQHQQKLKEEILKERAQNEQQYKKWKEGIPRERVQMQNEHQKKDREFESAKQRCQQEQQQNLRSAQSSNNSSEKGEQCLLM